MLTQLNMSPQMFGFQFLWYFATLYSLYVYAHDSRQIRVPIQYYATSKLPPCAMTWFYY